MKVSISKLRLQIVDTLGKKFGEKQANQIADYLLWADMSGNRTQGLIKMTGTEPLQDVKPIHEIKVERDTKLSQLINAGANPAPLVSLVATEAAIKKAEEHGFAIVGVHNYFSSTGAQAYYAEKMANKDLIGIVVSSQPSSVAPFNSIDALLGTNPIGFGFPTNEDPIIFDMATSAMTWYGLVLAKAQGKEIPEDVAIDANGNPTKSPEAAMEGALLPFDRSYKGSGLSMVIEILAGPLVNAAYCDPKGEWGALFIAVDPNLLVDTHKFKANCSDLVRKIKSSREKPGTGPIRLPGEHSHASYKEAQKSGMVEIDEAVLKQLGYI